MSNTNPTVSICIANYNGEQIIEDCLSSVFGQTTDCSYEVIVHDDASVDNSISLLKTYGEQITLICSESNVGFSVSNNRMVEAARGEFILLLNNDATLFPNALQVLHDYSKIHAPDAILSIPQYDIQTGDLIDRGMILDIFCNPEAVTAPLDDVVMVMGSCLWIPRALWLEIGGFPTWFETLAEDMYLCLYARILGRTVKVIDGTGYYHWVGYSLGGGLVRDNKLVTTVKRKSKSERNKGYVMFLFYPPLALMFIFPLHIILFLTEGLLLGLLKRQASIFTDIYLNAVLALLKQPGFLVRKRREIQRKRQISARSFFTSFSWIHYKAKMLMKYGLPEIG